MSITGDGANFSVTTNMSLRLPTIGGPGACGPLTVEPVGTSWGELWNADFATIDRHTHALGFGAPIVAASLNIDNDVSWNNFNITALRSARFGPIALGALTASDLGCVIVSGSDLYFVDTAGNQIRLTAGGAVAGTPGSISGMVAPASVTYTPGSLLYQFFSGVNIVAGLACGPLLIGDASVVSGNRVTIKVPAGIGAGYTWTLPSALPSTNAGLLQSSTTGALSYFATLSGSDITFPNQLLLSASPSANVFAITPGTQLHLKGNRLAADASATPDIAFNSTVTRTAGFLTGWFNNGISKLYCDFNGNLAWAGLPGAANIVGPTGLTIITPPGPHWTVATTVSYWRDPVNMVHLRGEVIWDGSSTITPNIGTLPAGYRPSVLRGFGVMAIKGATVLAVAITVDNFGNIGTTDLPSGDGINMSIFLDGINFLADQ